MKKFIAHKALILTLVFASIWSVQTYALAPTPGPAIAPAAATRSARTQTIGEIWNRTELYFGSLRPDGSVVPETKFQRFVDEQVTPRFPDGLTVLTGYGQFRNSAGIILKERSMVLILLYPPEMTDASQRIEQIREAYKNAFQQESVLRVDSQATVSF
jgi:Protein of unknown function (DUF3574)